MSEVMTAPVETQTGTALAQIAPTNLVSAFSKKGGIEAIVAAVEAEARAQASTLDVTKPKDRKAITSLAYKIAQSKVVLDSTGKDLGEAARKTVNAINEDRRLGRERLEALQAEVRAPLERFEQIEKDRVAGHEAALAAIFSLANNVGDLSSDGIKARIWAVPAPEGRQWQEFSEKADRAICETLANLQQSHAAAVEREAAEIETERLRLIEADRIAAENEAGRIAREEQIAADAAALATMQAEAKAENERKAAALAIAQAEANAKRIADEAEANRIAAIERAKADAAAAVQAEQARVAATAAAKQAEDDARARNVAHLALINRAAVRDLMSIHKPAPLTEEQAKAVVRAIAYDLIANVKITY